MIDKEKPMEHQVFSDLHEGHEVDNCLRRRILMRVAVLTTSLELRVSRLKVKVMVLSTVKMVLRAGHLSPNEEARVGEKVCTWE